MSITPEWATSSGDAWAELWRETDRALGNLSPDLIAAVAAAAPSGSFRAFEVGCGAGSTSIALARLCPEASVIACDLSPSLVRLAQERTAGNERVRVVLGDAEVIALRERPFDLIFSRHGVMFFADPVRAFRSLRTAATGGARLVFSCFQDWEANPWASELACAAAGRPLPPPGREPSGFAFADTAYVSSILESAGWARAEWRPVAFRYIAGEGEGAVEQALSFLCEIGPASAIVRSLPEQEKSAAVERMRSVIEDRFDGERVEFPAAAWIWSASAGGTWQ